MTGSITDLRPGGFGYIASDAMDTPFKLPFRCTAVDGNGFDLLRIGQRVRFDRVPMLGNAQRYHAVHVAAYDDRHGVYAGGSNAHLAIETKR